MRPEPRLIAVRGELVGEHLVDRIVAAVEGRLPGDAPAEVEAALERVCARAEPPPAVALAARQARRGYLARIVESELFAAAREPGPAVGGADGAAGLARAEPDGPPDPRDPAPASWQVPGPGGHVRHYAALLGLYRDAPKGPDGRRRLPAGVTEGDLKRCWLFGFLLRCAEEARPGARPRG